MPTRARRPCAGAEFLDRVALLVRHYMQHRSLQARVTLAIRFVYPRYRRYRVPPRTEGLAHAPGCNRRRSPNTASRPTPVSAVIRISACIRSAPVKRPPSKNRTPPPRVYPRLIRRFWRADSVATTR